jgi:hypothetical protein
MGKTISDCAPLSFHRRLCFSLFLIVTCSLSRLFRPLLVSGNQKSDRMQFELLGEKWSDMTFRDFSSNAQLLGGVSSERVNALVSALNDEKAADNWIRFLLALHFQLGRRAEFVLNDVAIARLLQFIDLAKKHQQMNVVAELCVLLLALNTAASTAGVESQLCAEFLRATPELQRMLMPVVHRAFYHRGSSLSGDQFTALIVKQTIETSFHEHLRVFALTNSTTATVAVWIEAQLLRADIYGPKPLFGTAPVAVGIDNERCSKVYTLLHYMETPLPSQIHHQYLVSALAAFLRSIDRRKLPPLPLSAAEIVADYLLELFAQLNLCVSSKKVVLFTHKRLYGLRYMEAVASDALFIAARLASWYGDELGDALNAEVTGFMYSMLNSGRLSSFRLPADEAPELLDSEIQIPLLPLSEPTSVPLFAPDVLLRCVEFQIEISSSEEVLKFFDDLFGERMWNAFIEDPSFALQLCVLLLRSSSRLHSVLPQLAPRVLWLLSRQPHTLLPLVKRLIPFLYSEATALDIFFRIVFLPLINFADDFTPPTEENAPEEVMCHYVFFVELWSAMTDWTVTCATKTTRFASFCMRHSRSFEAWDSLHGNIGTFSPKMLSAYRIIRPLLHEYFQCPNLPADIFEALSAAYFFVVAPRHHRAVVTEYLHEMGRWIAEQRPLLVLHSTASFYSMLAQDFIPEGLRCWRMQRWASMVLSTALSAVVDQAVTVKEAARFFDLIHEQIWELLAVASCEVVAGGRGAGDADGDAALRRRSGCVVGFAHTTVGVNANGRPTDADMPQCAESVPEVREPNWQLDLAVWTAKEEPLRLHGSSMTEHLHALFLALAGLSRICPNVKERGIICLANAVRTLSKARGTQPAVVSELSSSLIATATLCMKLLRYPPISGLNTMPLHALLGIHVLGVPTSLTRDKVDAAAAAAAAA